MKKDTQKCTRLRRYRCFFFNTSHFLLLGAEGGGGSLFVVLYGMYSTLYMYGGGYLRLTLDGNCYLNPIAMTNCHMTSSVGHMNST